jgi:hypothetical protein
LAPFSDIFVAHNKLVTAYGGSFFYSYTRSKGETTKPLSPNVALYGHKLTQLPFVPRASDKWAQNWVIYDYVDCPHLDFDASFLPNTTKVTDVDGDGVDEITVAYKLLCRGGMDFDTVKVILRQGDMKFAIRGEVELRFPGQAPPMASLCRKRRYSYPRTRCTESTSNVSGKRPWRAITNKLFVYPGLAPEPVSDLLRGHR